MRSPIQSDSLSTQVYAALKKEIFTGVLKPGEPLRELHLARTLIVSQATVREALLRLEQDGLVIRSQNRKTKVTDFSPDDVRDRLTIRMTLEELAAVRAMDLMTDADLQHLGRLAEAIDVAISQEDRYAMTLADIEFHRFIWACAQSPVMLSTLEKISTPVFAYMAVSNSQKPLSRDPSLAHARLVEALSSRQPEDVRRVIRMHVEDSYGSVLQLSMRAGNGALAVGK